jgi:hypothetical protein
MKRRDIDDIIEPTPSSKQRGFQIGEGQADLGSKSGSGEPSVRLPTWPDTNNRLSDRTAAE